MVGLYAVTVVAGIHHMYTLIDLGQLARYGYTYWLPLASAANVAQGGAALAVALNSKDTKVKSMALPSALSACMGITEPAIFGVNLRYFKPFLGGLLGGACGMVRLHRGSGCHRHRRHRHLRHPAAPAYAPAVHHHDGHLLRRVLRRDLGHLEP